MNSYGSGKGDWAKRREADLAHLGPKPVSMWDALAQVVRLATDEPDDKIAVMTSFGIRTPGVAEGLTYRHLRLLLVAVTDPSLVGPSQYRELALREIAKER